MRQLLQALKTKELRAKILFIAGLLIVYRLAAAIPLPGVDVLKLEEFFSQNEIFGLLNMFSGGGLANISLVLLGVAPYITASIIMQLLATTVPRLEQMYKEEGEAGRQKFTMITRWLSVPLAIVQTFGLITLLESQGVFGTLAAFDKTAIVITATAGTVFLMWLGELITEKQIGNGVSLLIFAGIAASLPGAVSQFVSADYQSGKFFTTLVFLGLGLLIIAAVVWVTEAERAVPVTYAKRMRGNQVAPGAASHLPLRVNMAGVIPIIFAVSLILIPGIVANFVMRQAHNERVIEWATLIAQWFQPTHWFYGAFYFLLVVAFTYFYTAVVFDPRKIAENLQKNGGYVPGVRPGGATADYLQRIVTRITLAGSVFLGLVAVLPFIAQSLTNIQALTLGGTSLLIAVSVVMELSKNIQGQLAMRGYEEF